MDPLILASASPQRAALLRGIGVAFEVIPSAVDEEGHPERDPAKRAEQLACAKARDVAVLHPGRWVLGCDTLVVASDGAMLEKPRDAEEAAVMIRRQSGGDSIIHSAVALVTPKGDVIEGLDSSRVRFRSISEEDIAWWIALGFWEGRSGAFQIDGPGQLLIERIEGDWSGVVGLPIYLLGQLMKQAGFPLMNQAS